MKVVILAGGYGTRISEESQFKPKPMIEIGGMPILWHIMKVYSYYGYNEFVVCAGYRQESIKKWFNGYFLHTSDITFDFTDGKKVIVHNQHSEPWKVTIVDTGLDTMTGGRIKRIKDYINNEQFLLTYGDGVANINIDKLVDFHKQQKKLITLSAVMPEGRFGVMDIEGNFVRSFREKSKMDAGWINGGYMVVEPEVLDYIADDMTVFEREPLEKLAQQGQLLCYKHREFWHCMDTLRDRQYLEQLWKENRAPWKVWDDNGK